MIDHQRFHIGTMRFTTRRPALQTFESCGPRANLLEQQATERTEGLTEKFKRRSSFKSSLLSLLPPVQICFVAAGGRAKSPVRLAISLLEVTAAAAILAVLMTISVQMLQAVNSQQRSAERRALALATVQALSEQFGNVSWDELTAEAAEKVEIPAAAKRHLPGAKLGVTVHQEQDPVVAKRVAITLVWNGPYGQATAPMRLTTWVFPDASLRQEQ
jgi:hypothetical protein